MIPECEYLQRMRRLKIYMYICKGREREDHTNIDLASLSFLSQVDTAAACDMGPALSFLCTVASGRNHGPSLRIPAIQHSLCCCFAVASHSYME
jgi:hypothetical protein